MRHGIVIALALAAPPVAGTPCDEYFPVQLGVENLLLRGVIETAYDAALARCRTHAQSKAESDS